MIVTAWNNGDHHRSGAGYGLKIKAGDRDQYFKPEWKSIFLEIEGEPQPVEINIQKASFWNKTCRELINSAIGKWLLAQGLAPWPKGHPPTLLLEPVAGNRFKVRKIRQ